MAGRINNILTIARCCYAVTKSFRQTLGFIISGNNGQLTKIRLKSGTTVLIRKTKIDKDVFLSTFYNQYHRVNYPLGQSPLIVDLGINIGLTVVDYLEQYPTAKIIGVEMDSANFHIAQQNTVAYTNVTLLQKAIWREDGFITYTGSDPQSYSVASSGQQAEAVSMNTLLKEIARADLVKMDIESAEYDLLLEPGNKTWLRKIKYLNIEVHNTAQQDAKNGMLKIIQVLEANNFDAVPSDNHWSSIIAVNKDLA